VKPIFERLNKEIADRFGGRQPALRTLFYHALMVFSVYSRYEKIDWRSVKRVVFVCLGNICRSAYAEAVASKMGIACVSFGLSASTGSPPDESAVRVASRRAVDLEGYRATNVALYEYRPGDLVVGFEPDHLSMLRKQGLPGNASVSLAGLWSHRKIPYIHDPYGLSDNYFENCFDRIDEGLAGIAGRIEKEHAG
jgi:protein-tyrosine phosphatase